MTTMTITISTIPPTDTPTAIATTLSLVGGAAVTEGNNVMGQLLLPFEMCSVELSVYLAVNTQTRFMTESTLDHCDYFCKV